MKISSNLIVVCGHYGTGKTNFSLNLAVDFAGRGEQVTLCDLDIVNPFFRVSDFPEVAQSAGIELITPSYSRSNIDVPSLPAAMDSITERPGRVIVDVGGDDAGSTALGRYSRRIAAGDYAMLLVINRYRALSVTAEETAELLREIEAASRLRATGIINNSHLMELTTPETIIESIPYAEAVAGLTGLPVMATAAERRLIPALEGRIDDLYPMDVYVKPVWK